MHRAKRLFATPRRAIVTVAILALIVTGSAYAAWTFLNVSGGATAQGVSISAPTVTAAGPTFPGTATQLTPGADGDVVISVTNNNTVALKLTSVDISVGNVTSTNQAGCPGSTWVTWNTGNISALNISIPTGTTTVVIPNAVKMGAGAPVACNGASFNFTTEKFNFST